MSIEMWSNQLLVVFLICWSRSLSLHVQERDEKNKKMLREREFKESYGKGVEGRMTGSFFVNSLKMVILFNFLLKIIHRYAREIDFKSLLAWQDANFRKKTCRHDRSYKGNGIKIKIMKMKIAPHSRQYLD